MKFNFETRELCPYREDWNSKMELCGALWYVKEKDGIYLLDSPITRPLSDKSARPYNELLIAKGLPAAVLAQGNDLLLSNFNFIACYQAYFEEIRKYFPEKPAYDMPTVLDDWEFFLAQTTLIERDHSEYLHKLSQMRVAVFLRDLSNPFHAPNLESMINQKYYYTCTYPGKKEPKLIFSHMPAVNERTEAPMILACDLDKEMETAKLQADGFMAAIINLAIYHFWERRWSEYNFTDIEVIEKINKAYKKQFPIIDIAEIAKLSFDLPIEVEDICKAYMTAFEPIMRKVWKMKPEVQLACIEGDLIYSYIYAHEAESPDRLYASELYASLNNDQKRTLVSYGRRFMEWMVKTYPITPHTQHLVMQAIAKDMPPIQLTIKNDIKVTRANAQEDKPKKKKSPTKFKYIISDDRKEIAKIHKRIELHLASPAELRDELVRLQNEALVSLPMENPTAIIRAIYEVWGEDEPKERSFVTTWGRRV